MSVDLSQFHQVFFEESFEGLDVMESALLNLDLASVESETINEIFRAAHSIKGGSGTFGFNEVAEFTHVVETLLDMVRSDQFELEHDSHDLLLSSVDCIRTMIQQLSDGEEVDTTQAKGMKVQFEAFINGGSPEQASSSDGEETDSGSSQSNGDAGWTIFFRPDKDVLRTGNEPIRMFRELAELGELTVSCVADDLPLLGSLDPESCHLAWNMTLIGQIDRAQVDEVFEWVIDESELKIESIGAETQSQQTESAEPVVEAQTPQTSEPVAQAAEKPPEKAETPKPAKKPAAKKAAGKDKQEVSSIRVGTDKVDSLINMVGELVITQSMLGELGRDFDIERLPRLMEGLEQLSQHTRELQENVMRIRMLPISFAFSRFPRLVHDISRNLGKKVELVLSGEQTELDKTVMERIGDPLVHLVRNSMDHGIESPDVRVANGKPETGKITLDAFHQGGNIVIQIIDDGAGLNRERILSKAIEKGLVSESDNLTNEQIDDLVFRPGFSTAAEITDISGRGVGMDVVRRNIQELNGSVEVESHPGQGSTFTIRLPLTLAILDGQLVRVGQHVYILPLISIVESIQSHDRMIHRVAGGCDVLRLRDEYVPIIRLWDIFNVKPDSENIDDGLLVVVEADNMKLAILVDDLLAQQQVVIKSLEDNYLPVEGLSGATILGDGTVSLILDILGMIKLSGVSKDEYKAAPVSEDSEAA